MKKTLILTSVALVAIMLVPIANVAADNIQTDVVSVTVPDNCAISYSDTGHIDGESTGTWDGDELKAVIAVGTTNDDIGASVFNVICNYQTGWRVVAEPESLLAQDLATNNAITNAIENEDGSFWNYTPSKIDSSDTDFVVGESNASVVANMNSAVGDGGKNFKITYSATIGATQAADTYKGSIEYTLVKGAE